MSQISQVDDQPLDGLKAILQDRSGFIWLAGNKGLWRFDGQALKYFGRKQPDGSGLPHQDVRDMVEDPQGYLWLITRGGGLSRFDPQTESFVNFSHDANNIDTLDSDQLNSISLGNGDVLWIGSNVGINRFDRKRLKNTRLNIAMQPSTSGERNNIQRVFEDSQGRLWFSVRRKGVYLYRSRQKSVLHFEHQPDDPSSLDDNMVSDIFESAAGDIWLGTSGGINRFRATTMDFERLAIPLKDNNKVNHAAVTRIYQDDSDILWIGTFYNGVSTLSPGTNRLIEVNNGGNFSNSLNVLHINDIMQDDSGTLWFVTPRSGLLKMTPSAMRFKHWLKPGIAANPLTGVAVDNTEQIWLAGSDGLFKIDNAGEAIKVEGIDSVTAMVAVAQGVVIYSVTQGLVNIDENGLRSSLNWQGNKIVRLFKGSGKHLLLIDEHGLSDYDRDANSAQLLLQASLTGAIEELDGFYYLALSDGGIMRINEDATEQVRLRNVGVFNQMHRDGQNRLWAVSTDGRLWSLNVAKQVFEPYQGLDGLQIQSIASDSNGYLWLGTAGGLLRLNVTTTAQNVYTTEQGQRLSEFTPNLTVRLNTGDILMAGHKGVVRFAPSSFAQDQVDAVQEGQILLSDFKLFSQLMPLRSQDPSSPLQTTIDNTQLLQLSYRQNWFSIAFASSDYRQPENLRYSYRLEGLSEQWIDTEPNNRTATFTSVKPGEYTLLFRIIDPKHPERESLRKLKIVITPPWYASNLAYFLYIVCAIGLVYLFNFLRTRQLRNRAAALERGIAERTAQLHQRAETIARLLDEKDKLIANISHEFRTPLTLILGPLESQLKNAPDEHSKSLLALAQGNGQRLLAMVDQLLDMARLKDQPKTALQHKNVQHSCRFLLASFAELAKNHQIRMTFDNRLDKDVFVDVLPDTLEKVLSNLLSNAVKYGGNNQQITLRLEVEGDYVAISVIDTGPGIAIEQQAQVFERFTRLKNNPDYVPGSGIGLALVKDLVEQHQGKISLHSEVAAGTTFTVTLPLASKSLDDSQSEDERFNSAIVAAAVEQITVSERPKLSLKGNLDGTKTQILVIEDNQDMRHYIVSCLEPHYQCEQAPNGEQGLQQAQANLPDLVVSDVMMPIMDGFEVTKALKSDHATSHIPVVLLTARGDRQSRLRGWAEKADDYLEKPFNAEELVARVSNLLSVRQMLSEKYQAKLGDTLPGEPQQPVTVEASHNESEQNGFHQAFVAQVNRVLEQYYSDDQFDVAGFADKMALSHRQLGRKMKSLLNMTPAEAIRDFRLVKAAELLKSGTTPSVAAHKVGFSTHSYFSQCFKARFHCNPSEFGKLE